MKANSGVFALFDLTKKETLNEALLSLSFAKNKIDTIYKPILIANKADLTHLRSIRKREAEETSKKEGLTYIEVSCLSGEQIDKCLGIALKQVIELIEKQRGFIPSQTSIEIIPNKSEKLAADSADEQHNKKCELI